jgi:hypothetical protein
MPINIIAIPITGREPPGDPLDPVQALAKRKRRTKSAKLRRRL